MRLAWFAPRPPDPTPVLAAADDAALLAAALAGRHHIDRIDERRAHDFVWQQARAPWDLCVYELAGTPAHQFVAAYAAHYPGVLLLRGLPRHDRAIAASRLVVVPHEPVAQAIADDYPGTRVRTVVPGVEPLPASAPAVVEALAWPPDGAALTLALAGFAAQRAVIVFDMPETADWPSLDPRDWQPRGWLRRDPICVSLDPRDAAHSLRLARQRLDADPALCQRLGAAAHAWWLEHATVAAAAARFERLLEEARTLPVAPAVEVDDGTARARRILEDLGLPAARAGILM